MKLNKGESYLLWQSTHNSSWLHREKKKPQKKLGWVMLKVYEYEVQNEKNK